MTRVQGGRIASSVRRTEMRTESVDSAQATLMAFSLAAIACSRLS